MKILLTAALAVLVNAGVAAACSPPPSWMDTGFWIVGGDAWSDDAIEVDDPERLVLQTEGFEAPPFADFAPLLEITVTGPDGEVTGTLEPSPLFAHASWIPDTPFQDGATYTFHSRVIDSWREEGRTIEFTVRDRAAAPVEGEVTLATRKVERQITGDCVSDVFDSCGFCGEHEVLGTELRIALDFAVTAPATRWPGARAMRIAAGVDPTEALAILDRTPYATFGAERGLDVAAYPNWPRDAACGAVEVVDAAGEVLLREAKCVAVVPDPALGAAIDARLGREVDPARPRTPTSDPGDPAITADDGGEGGGCRATGAPASGAGWLAGLVLLAGLRRRRA